MYALVGIAVQQTLLSLQHIPVQRWVVCAMAAVTLGGIFLHSTPVEARLFAVTPGMHGTYRGVQVERWHVNRFLVIAAFFDREKASAADSLLTYDIGVTGARVECQSTTSSGLSIRSSRINRSGGRPRSEAWLVTKNRTCLLVQQGADVLHVHRATPSRCCRLAGPGW